MTNSNSQRVATLTPAAMPPVTTKVANAVAPDAVVSDRGGVLFSGGHRRRCHRLRHRLAEPYALGDAAVLRIVEAGVGDLQAADRRLHRRDAREEARRADRLGMFEPPDMGRDEIAVADRGIDFFEAGHGFFDEGGIGALPERV